MAKVCLSCEEEREGAFCEECGDETEEAHACIQCHNLSVNINEDSEMCVDCHDDVPY